jgi:putative glycosyltransferase (TIGR04348 family)
MKIALITPAGPRSRNGNRHTALRWAGMLRALGHSVRVARVWDGRPADAMIALHARRSHASIAAFRGRAPDRPLAVVLTGTDLYRDIRGDRDARASLDLGDRFVVLQDMARKELAPSLRRRTRVIYQSAESRPSRAARGFRIVVLGHLREEKDPFRAALALAHLKDLPEIEVLHLGEAIAPGMERRARRMMRLDSRYRWIGGVSHRRALGLLAGSRLMVLSSRMEGGANVVCEAAAAGVPVIASRVSGNVGMLGRGYPGYYRLGDERALARLIRRAATDPAYYARLKRLTASRRPLFRPSAEKAGLRALVADLRGLQRSSSSRTGAKVRR